MAYRKKFSKKSSFKKGKFKGRKGSKRKIGVIRMSRGGRKIN